jgi:hypothetical protein
VKDMFPVFEDIDLVLMISIFIYIGKGCPPSSTMSAAASVMEISFDMIVMVRE